MDKKRVLFVCLGNICRSPAAEGVFSAIVKREGVSDRFEIDSAGTYGGHAGQKADKRMRVAAAQRGYDLTSRSRQISYEDFEDFDIILTMDDRNYERVHRLAPDHELRKKIFRMTDFCRTIQADHVPDPYYEGVTGFEIVLNILEDSCQGLFEQINSGKV